MITASQIPPATASARPFFGILRQSTAIILLKVGPATALGLPVGQSKSSSGYLTESVDGSLHGLQTRFFFNPLVFPHICSLMLGIPRGMKLFCYFVESNYSFPPAETRFHGFFLSRARGPTEGPISRPAASVSVFHILLPPTTCFLLVLLFLHIKLLSSRWGSCACLGVPACLI